MKLCDYGCGQEAIHQFKNGKWCCSKSFSQCPEMRKKNGDGNRGKFPKGKHPNSGKPAWNKNIPRTAEERANISKGTKKGMMTPRCIQKLKNRPIYFGAQSSHWKGGYDKRGIAAYDKFFKDLNYCEKIRRNKQDLNILEAKCNYCGKWYIPSLSSVYSRVSDLNFPGDGCKLYCSNQCKQECSTFYQSSYPKDHKPATSREVQPELRQLRFQIDNYTCQKCGKHQDELECGLHCHHIEGVRWEPLESADVDKVITYCKNCHIEVHQKDGCGYNDMKCGK